ncbi:LITAF-like zinc ribbon domain-containing protein [Pilobolus umbonatus]|nr:LITAF-like zinc ribbon domain-containing protein [Pilobolus umbonatus]
MSSNQDHHHHTIKPSNPVYGTLPSPSMVPSVMVPVQSIEYLKETPAVIKCPFCHETAWTELDYTVGKLTIISSMLLFAFGCHTGGCLIPLAVPQCRNVVHSCTSCHTKLAIYKRLEGKTELLTTD